MSIAFSKYVRIISGVGGGVGVRQRDLTLRVFSESALLSPGSVYEFTSAANVALYFGSDSEEAARAALYFAYVSPAINTARLISFARYAASGASSAVIGNNDPKAITQWAGAAAGVFSITLAGVTSNVGPLNLSATATLSAVATALQTAIRALGAPYTTATVTYGGSLRPNGFIVTVPGAVGAISINSTGTGGNDIAQIAGLNATSNAINSQGVAPQSPRDAVLLAQGVSNNYGSFLFIPTLTLSQVEAVAAGNAAENVKFMYSQRVTRANAAAWFAALLPYGGTGLTLEKEGEYQDQIPPTILGATDYNKRNAVQNYMYRQLPGMSASVTETGDSDTLDAQRINYYGATSTAGQLIQFYQRGTLMGTGTDATDMNVYANEMWLKDYASSQLMSLQLSVGRIPANDSGRGMILNVLQGPIDAALRNGTISVGKTLNNIQKAYISQMTGDDNAWQVVQNTGYVLSCVIESYTTTSGATEYKAVYSLIYSKDDAVRLIEGTHTLI